MRRFAAGMVALLGLSLSSFTLAAPFIRSDANFDGVLDISDGVSILGILFLGDEVPNCGDVLDSNDDGRVDVSDASFALNFLFSGGPDIPPPFPDCGTDPTDDELDCASYSLCDEVECFADDDLAELVRASVPSTICVAADVAEFEVAGVAVTACARGEANPSCGGSGAPGCPVEITSIESVFERAATRARVSVTGQVRAFPIQIGEDEGALVCSADADFSGDVVVPYAGRSVAGGLEIETVGAPVVENLEVELDVSGGLLCALLGSQQALFAQAIADQLESASADLVDAFEAEIVGQVICAE